ncbi:MULTISPECIES: sialate O-acetylesterase [unclassified Arcicella]|uniref:sialate O-acetylesterase n=1 Tax=unclassified Arcicella TaxID=2644986 RepID=UPI00285BD160|nr:MULTISPECIES: sialate O-acetylesterase [unclassified Arcicella]MDR6562952.1 sialate O-acetylesterase [Arcicella sp. BE51]MDR6813036.1 sialate O-acetylesterase [Arcicella sp. BE140]MDR6824350.1 sialate O-acetylesterase [Arcicella sp. BE139]
MKKTLLICLSFISVTCFGQVKLARLFSDHVVLQRQKPIPVWGWANANEKVNVTLAGQSQNTKADATGKWMVKFTPLEAGGPFKMTVTAKSGSINVNDILIGEVWLCSGQSNMEWRVSQANNFNEEKKNADYPKIRHFYVEHEVTIDPQADLKSGEWKVASPENVGNFTAVGFFFARELYQKLNIPIGLLHSSWGGSQVEGWISKEGMLTNNELKSYAEHLPSNWKDADYAHDQKVQKQLLGSNINPTVEDEKKYLTANYDISKWLYADSPMGQWDWKGIWAYRGDGYMARTIEVPKEAVSTETTLALAENDSYNEIYINGKLVSQGVIKGVRKITVPANTWQTGTNQLMIKFGNMQSLPWMGLGLIGSATDLYVEVDNQKISIATGWRLMPSFAGKHEYVHSSNNVGTTIYNGMIAPLVPFAMRGSLWYQGEANTGRAYQYRQTFPLMIEDWRKKWNDNFSFYFVQLANYGPYQNSNQGSNWAELREAQTMTLSLPKTGMAVITDIGNPNDIHPTNKQDVGHRLAINALKKDFGQNIEYSSPMFESVSYEDGKAIVSFKNIAKGLVIQDKFGYLKGFEIAGEDKVFYYAKAELVDNKVIVYHPKGLKPISVRYAWADSPMDANLFNSEGLPANSFRTDTWPGMTINTKFE